MSLARLAPRRLAGRDRYERRMEAWTDNLHADAFTHTVRLADDVRAVELWAVALPSPAYTVRQCGARVLAGPVAPEAVTGVRTLAGVAMVSGFTRRVAEATGGGEGADLLVDAAVEIARLARQTAKLPRARAERAMGDPRACWELDTAGWVDLPDSCFTYTAAGRALFETRSVSTPVTPDLYSPSPGQRRVFVRRRVARLERGTDRLRLFHSLEDPVHAFELHLEVELATARIVRATHTTPRLPYMGVCSEPQARLQRLVGEPVDEGLRQRLGGLIGGSTGCAQLYDLVADLLKLLAP